jgi:hypothetical protein
VDPENWTKKEGLFDRNGAEKIKENLCPPSKRIIHRA